MKDTKLYGGSDEIMTHREPEYLIDYIRLGYTIVATTHIAAKALKQQYPNAVITNSNTDGISGSKLLVDQYATCGRGIKAALPKFNEKDVVYRNFTSKFIEGKPDKVVEANQLEIKLKDVNSAPEIYIRGEKVENITDFNFRYGTETATERGECEYELKHYDRDKQVTCGLARMI